MPTDDDYQALADAGKDLGETALALAKEYTRPDQQIAIQQLASNVLISATNIAIGKELKRIAEVMEASTKPVLLTKSELSPEELAKLDMTPGPITPAPKDPMERIADKLSEIESAIRQGLNYVAGSSDRGGF